MCIFSRWLTIKLYLWSFPFLWFSCTRLSAPLLTDYTPFVWRSSDACVCCLTTSNAQAIFLSAHLLHLLFYNSSSHPLHLPTASQPIFHPITKSITNARFPQCGRTVWPWLYAGHVFISAGSLDIRSLSASNQRYRTVIEALNPEGSCAPSSGLPGIVHYLPSRCH